ncbi:MAG: HAD family hydrolase [Smithellaceae bacterium]|jgi:phosphoglycolate phosphatase
MAALKINGIFIKTVVFDFDGTLAKLNIDFKQMRDAVLKLISSYGIARNYLQTDFVLEMINTSKEILSKSSPQKAEIFTNKAIKMIEAMEIEAAINGELFPQTKELFTCLKLSGISTGVITRNCDKAIKTVFPDILSYCEVVVCRDMVKNVKPNPEHLNKALQMLNTSANTTLMIGDHPLDIQTGRNAGTYTAGVLTGHFRKSDFLNAGADLLLYKASDLLNMIN